MGGTGTSAGAEGSGAGCLGPSCRTSHGEQAWPGQQLKKGECLSVPCAFRAGTPLWFVPGEFAGEPGASRLPSGRLVPQVLSVWPAFLFTHPSRGGSGDRHGAADRKVPAWRAKGSGRGALESGSSPGKEKVHP